MLANQCSECACAPESQQLAERPGRSWNHAGLGAGRGEPGAGPCVPVLLGGSAPLGFRHPVEAGLGERWVCPNGHPAPVLGFPEAPVPSRAPEFLERLLALRSELGREASRGRRAAAVLGDSSTGRQAPAERPVSRRPGPRSRASGRAAYVPGVGDWQETPSRRGARGFCIWHITSVPPGKLKVRALFLV